MIYLISFCYSRLSFERVQVSIEKDHRLGLVLVMVRESVEALGEVESEYYKG